jgi:CubicO group peptidase (beta-lactamase class C family)
MNTSALNVSTLNSGETFRSDREPVGTVAASPWGGVYGTHFWVDPKEGLSVVVLTNTAVAGMIGAFPSALQRAAYST